MRLIYRIPFLTQTIFPRPPSPQLFRAIKSICSDLLLGGRLENGYGVTIGFPNDFSGFFMSKLILADFGLIRYPLSMPFPWKKFPVSDNLLLSRENR